MRGLPCGLTLGHLYGPTLGHCYGPTLGHRYGPTLGHRYGPTVVTATTGYRCCQTAQERRSLYTLGACVSVCGYDCLHGSHSSPLCGVPEALTLSWRVLGTEIYGD